MKPAQERLRADLEAVEFRDLACPLIDNWRAREVRTGAEAREGLYQQVSHPVRWVEAIRGLENRGVAQAVEVGAGSVLTGLLRSTAPSLAGFPCGTPADLDKLPARR
jgi:[acyl-carrier-protein] S-malonyltransferase